MNFVSTVSNMPVLSETTTPTRPDPPPPVASPTTAPPTADIPTPGQTLSAQKARMEGAREYANFLSIARMDQIIPRITAVDPAAGAAALELKKGLAKYADNAPTPEQYRTDIQPHYQALLGHRASAGLGTELRGVLDEILAIPGPAERLARSIQIPAVVDGKEAVAFQGLGQGLDQFARIFTDDAEMVRKLSLGLDVSEKYIRRMIRSYIPDVKIIIVIMVLLATQGIYRAVHREGTVDTLMVVFTFGMLAVGIYLVMADYRRQQQADKMTLGR